MEFPLLLTADCLLRIAHCGLMNERVTWLRRLWLAALGGLVLRVADLQLIRGAAYRELAEHNRLRLIWEPAPRGPIADREGRLLAGNATVFHVSLIPQEVADLAGTFERLGALTERPVAELRQTMRREQGLPFLPVSLLPRVSKEVAIRLEERRRSLPGVLVQAQTLRSYPLGTRAAQVVGYLGLPNAEEMELLKPYGVRSKERIGRAGLEQALDHALRGRPGGQVIEVDHRARQVRVVNHLAPEPGAAVTLTLDARLQELIEQAFGAQPGAAVALDPSTGAVLAMVSVPAFSPELFLAPSGAALQALLDDPAAPLMNRSTVGAYQPGSILKLVTAAAALEAGVISPQATLSCGGSLTIGDRTIHCWNRDGHGPLMLRGAFRESCNVYFMQLGRRLGAPRLLAALRSMGLAQRTGWSLPEQPGHLPERRLTEGEVALLAMGQGEVLITPLQAAIMAAAFANEGRMVTPWVVDRVEGRPMPRSASPRRLPWAPATLQAVREGMRAVVADPGGTGWYAASQQVEIAGKTGTAQTHVVGKTHGWFVGFCPIEQPRLAFAVVTEHGGSGGDLPAAIGRIICEWLVTDQ